MPRLDIIGCGQLGRTLARLWHRTGTFEIGRILNRTPESTAEAVRFIGAGLVARELADLEGAAVTLIATPDDEIAAVCTALTQSGCVKPGQIVFHCSGALPAAILEAAARQGAAIASVHPIRSFADPEQAAARFAGTWCGAEGDRAALDMLEPAFQAVGAHIVAIDPAYKTIYHGAAVFASNYLVSVLELALQAYGQAGVPRATALQLIAPLVRGTIDNVLAQGTAEALSGPIARADTATVLRQYRALKSWNRDAARAYRILAKPAVSLARRRGGKR